MRRVLIPLALLLVLGMGVQAYAASAISLLEPYKLNWLEDDDYESGILKSTGTTLEEGDLLYGMVVINPFVETVTTGQQRLVSTNGATFTGIFCVEVDTKTEVGVGTGIYDFTFTQASAADWLTYTGYTLKSSNTMAVLFDDDDAPSYIDPNTGTTLGSLATAQDGIYLWEFGFDDNSDGFWSAFALTDVVANIATTRGALTFNAALDVTDDTGAGPALLPFSLYDYTFASVFMGIYTDLQLTGGNILSGGVTSDFDVLTDSEIYLKPTPEPGTLALLGLGLLGLGGVVYRRRRS